MRANLFHGVKNLNLLASTNAGLFSSWRNRSHLSTMKAPVKVLVAGAAGQIGYSILLQLAKGDILGLGEKTILNLYDVEPCKDIMNGIKMELQDCAYPTLVDVNVYTDAYKAFKDIDYAVMIANKQVLTAEMKRVDLLKANCELFTEMGQIFEAQSKESAKVLMVANPCNTNALIMMENAPSRHYSSFSSLSRLDHNRLISFVARKLGVTCDLVKKAIVWGNHSSSMWPDARFMEYKFENSPLLKFTPVYKDIDVDDYVLNDLVPKVKERAFEVIRARKKSSALSAGNAAVDHLKDWHLGTPDGNWVSMGVYSDGTKYGIPAGIFYAMPVICYDKKYSIVEGLPIDDFTREKMQITAEELLEEKKLAGLE